MDAGHLECDCRADRGEQLLARFALSIAARSERSRGHVRVDVI
jgi:hypothetical protein